MVRSSFIEIKAQCEGQRETNGLDGPVFLPVRPITAPSRAQAPVSMNQINLTKGPQGHLHCNTSITVYCKYHQFD